MSSRKSKSRRPTVPFKLIGALLAGGAALIGIFASRRQWMADAASAEHPAPDLALDQPRPGPNDRAPEAFRPDPTAPVTAAEREALRPALVKKSRAQT